MEKFLMSQFISNHLTIRGKKKILNVKYRRMYSTQPWSSKVDSRWMMIHIKKNQFQDNPFLFF